MLIGNKKFPYPLLKNIEKNEDYQNTQFYLELETDNGKMIIDNDKLVLKNICFFLDNKDLKKLYDEGKIKAYCEIECSNTIFSDCFEITNNPTTKELPIGNFMGKVSISAYLIATEEINNYQSSDFVNLFAGRLFHINPSDVLAFDDMSFNIEINEANDNKISSIFTIVRKDDAMDIVTYHIDKKKIVIYLNQECYRIYETMKMESTYYSFFYSALVIPVLSNCLIEIQKNLQDDYTFEEICEDNKWFRSVVKSYESIIEKELDIDEFNNANCYEMAQSLMGGSTDKSIKDFYSIISKNVEAIEDE